MDKHSSHLGKSQLPSSSMEDPVCGRPISSTMTLSPAAGPSKRRTVARRLEVKTEADAVGRLGGFLRRAHLG